MKLLFYKILSWFGHTEYHKLGGVERSPLWPKVRKQFLIDNDECAVCCTKENLEVHHVIPFHKRPEKELDPKNLLPMCEVHHLWFGHLGSWRSYNIRVREDSNLFKYAIQRRP